jgi:hypothetical protein
MNRLTVDFRSDTPSDYGFQDCKIKEICEAYLGYITEGDYDPYLITGQELVIQMFRALLFREYKHLQPYVCFIVDGKGVVYDSDMRNASGIYPPSIYDDCCDILLGCV